MICPIDGDVCGYKIQGIAEHCNPLCTRTKLSEPVIDNSYVDLTFKYIDLRFKYIFIGYADKKGVKLYENNCRN